MQNQSFSNAPKAAPKFNWPEIVAQAKPGSGSAARQQLLLNLVTDLSQWADHYQLTEPRRQVSAYTAAVIIPPDGSVEMGQLIARYIMWVFDLDGFIDRLDFARLKLDTAPAKLAYLDRQLSHILKPLYQAGYLKIEQTESWGLPGEVALPDELPELEAPALRLSLALADLCQKLAAGQIPQFGVANFNEQVARMSGAMRRELAQSFGYQESGSIKELPNLESYLANSKFSIAVSSVEAIAACYEKAPQTAWQSCAGVLDSGAKVIRLANDLGNYWSELAERKINSLTVALAELGFAPMGDYQEGSPEVAQARQSVGGWLQAELKLFAEGLSDLAQAQNQEGPLLYSLQNTVAFALAMFEKGDYIEPE